MNAEKTPGYKTLRLLGRGGMGSVYLAQREATGQTVALKVSKGSLGEHGIARLRREAELLSRIDSPFLPRYVDSAELENGNFLLAMDFVRGDPLQAYVTSEDEPGERLEMLRRALPGIAKGLLQLHEAGIVHRDMKPANVIINAQRAIVVDLGLARGPDVMTLTKTGAAVGTPEYMPPEQITGEPAGPAADLYQVGLIARDLLLGSRRAAGKDMIQEAMRRAIARPEDLRAAAPWIPPEVAEWIQRCLHPSPAGRPDPSEHLQRAVALCQQGMAPVAGASAGPEEPTWLGSDAHQEVLAARQEGEAKGWPAAEKAKVPSWLDGPPGAGGAPEGAAAPVAAPVPAAPAGQPAGTRATWVLGVVGVVLGLGVGLGFGGGAPAGAVGEKPEIVLIREGERLAVLEGPADLRMVAPVEAAFELGESGRRSVVAPEGEFTLRSEAAGAEWRGSGAVSLGLEVEDVALLEDQLWFQLGPGETPERLRFRWGEPAREWRAPGAEWVSLPKELLDQARFRVSGQLGAELWLENEVDMVAVLRALDERMGEMPQGDSAEETGAANEWLGRNGLRLRAILSSSAGVDELRESRYRKMARPVHREVETRSSPLRGGLPVTYSLGKGLSVVTHRELSAVGGQPLRVASTMAVMSQKIGRSASPHPRQPVEVLGKSGADLERLAGGVIRLHFSGYERSLPTAAEVSVHGTSFDINTRLRLEIGGKTLFLPASEKIFWRTHRIPGEWFRSAVSQDGELSFDLSLDRSQGFGPSPDAQINRIMVTVVYDK